MRHLPGVVLTTCLVVACGSPPPPSSPATTTAVAEAVVAPPPRPAAADVDTRVAAGPPAPRCRVTVTDTEGCGPGDIEVLIAPVRARIEHCRGATGGKLRVVVRKSAGKLAFEVAPGSSLDPIERQCVLDALTTLQEDESATAWTGLNVRPTGFTSLITIEW